MIASLLEQLFVFVVDTINAVGYGGIGFLMLLESANIPIPSEIIMTFAGFLVWEEKLDFWFVVLAGTIGNLAGSLGAYYLGMFGGRPILERYGKYVLITSHDLKLADRMFQKYGSAAVFVARLLPIVRTFISFPAGMARMNIWRFCLYTRAGSFLWSIILTYTGFVSRENWDVLEPYFRKLDWVVASLLLFGIVWWVWRHIKALKKY